MVVISYLEIGAKTEMERLKDSEENIKTLRFAL